MRVWVVLLVGILVWGVTSTGADAFELAVDGSLSAGAASLSGPRIANGSMSGVETGLGLQVTPTVYVGRLGHPRGMILSNDLPTNQNGITNVRPRPLSGIWLGAAADIRANQAVNLYIGGGALIANGTDGTITSTIGLTADFETAGDDWYYLESLAGYRTWMGLEVLAGFRWDHTASRLHVVRPGDSIDDFKINLFMPMVGLQLSRQSTEQTLKVKVAGFPAVPGSLKYHNWDRVGSASVESRQDFSYGYYAEIHAEYSRKIPGNCSVGLFGTWNVVNACTAVEAALNPGATEIRWIFDRRSWIVGGSLSIEFGL